MPWRKRTGTVFRLGDAANSESDETHSIHAAEPAPSPAPSPSDTELVNFMRFAGIPSEPEPSSQGEPVENSASVDSPVMEADEFGRLVAQQFISEGTKQTISLPWEQGVYYSMFTSDPNAKPDFDATRTFSGESVWVPVPFIDKRKPSESQPSSFVAAPDHEVGFAIFERAVLSMSDISFEQSSTEQMRLAADKWAGILLHAGQRSEAVRQVMNSSGGLIDRDALQDTVKAIIGTRSSRTAVTRANSISKFLRWCAVEFPEVEQLFSEALIWQYMQHLTVIGAAPTTASSFVSACRYGFYVLGIDDLKEACSSRRVQGSSNLMYVQKESLKQARVLQVSDIQWMHKQLSNVEMHIVDRAFCGYILICLYGRCRHSDLRMVHTITTDYDSRGGFIEISTRCHKNAKTVSSQSILLPIVLPAVGVSGNLWYDEVSAVFGAVGLKSHGLIGGPLFKPPTKMDHTVLCNRGITSKEVTQFLRLCCEDSESLENYDHGSERVSSHSLKAILLSWMSKYGCDPSVQASLGRHSSVYHETSTVYSRDAAVKAVRELQKVILAVSNSTFFPDALRSRYFGVDEQAQVPKEEIDGWELCSSNKVSVVKIELDAISISSVDSDGHETAVESCDSSESGEPVNMDPGRALRRRVELSAQESEFVKHVKSKLVHYCDQHSKDDSCSLKILACGKQTNRNYIAVGSFAAGDMRRLCRRAADRDQKL